MYEHPDAMDGSEVTHGDIRWMGRKPLTHEVLRDARPGERSWHDFPGQVLEEQSWPEAQARADEILADWKAWRDAITLVDETYGIPTAEARCDQLEAERRTLLARVAELPASTAEGLRVKIRAGQCSIEGIPSDAPSGRVVRSLLRDAGVAANVAEAPVHG